ncbi:hypothetical protein SDC9_205519 [bioreactor metagenome]|uniref:Uncharacterized protein n=1 Tax=bioreactor metagenome TaxID=1076179 RepID=A0A645J2A6_9ZZZZ
MREAEPQRAVAEERVFFMRHRKPRQGLVAADIERAQRHGFACGVRQHAAVCFKLVLFIGQKVGLHIEEFRAKKSYKITVAQRARVIGGADVETDFDACAVGKPSLGG